MPDLGRSSLLRGACVGLAGCTMLFASAAHAHSTAKGTGDFYAGFLHPLTAPEDVLAFLALGMLSAQHAPRSQLALPVFWLSLIAGAIWAVALPHIPWTDLCNVASVMVLGGLIALNAPMPATLLFAMAAVFGITHGFANGVAITGNVRSYLFIPGVAMAALMTTGYGLVFTDWLLRRKIGWIPIAVRVAGSWIAAIGMLVLATSWKTLTAG